jgi:hypothetical protein
MTITKLRFFALLTLCCAASSLVTARVMKIQQARADSNRVFELRIDKTYPGRLQALADRLAQGRPIFERNHMSIVGYWIPQDSPQHENTLIYMVAHESREAAKKDNAGFGSDPEFRALQKSSEADGKIIEKFETTYLDPLDFSPIK